MSDTLSEPTASSKTHISCSESHPADWLKTLFATPLFVRRLCARGWDNEELVVQNHSQPADFDIPSPEEGREDNKHGIRDFTQLMDFDLLPPEGGWDEEGPKPDARGGHNGNINGGHNGSINGVMTTRDRHTRVRGQDASRDVPDPASNPDEGYNGNLYDPGCLNINSALNRLNAEVNLMGVRVPGQSRAPIWYLHSQLQTPRTVASTTAVSKFATSGPWRARWLSKQRCGGFCSASSFSDHCLIAGTSWVVSRQWRLSELEAAVQSSFHQQTRSPKDLIGWLNGATTAVSKLATSDPWRARCLRSGELAM